MMRARANVRVAKVRQLAGEVGGLIDTGRYADALARAKGAADLAEFAGRRFLETAGVLLEAKNATFEAFAFWESLGREMETIKETMISDCSDCIEYLR